MKTYKVKLLTQKGQIERTITDSEDIDALNEAIRAEYGDFTTISSEEIGIDLFEDYEDQPEGLTPPESRLDCHMAKISEKYIRFSAYGKHTGEEFWTSGILIESL